MQLKGGKALQAIDLPLSNHKKTAALGVAALLLGVGYIYYKYKGGKNCGKETDFTGLDKKSPEPVPVNRTKENSDEAGDSRRPNETDSTGLDKNSPQPIPVNRTKESSDERDDNCRKNEKIYQKLGIGLAHFIDSRVTKDNKDYDVVMQAFKKINMIRFKVDVNSRWDENQAFDEHYISWELPWWWEDEDKDNLTMLIDYILGEASNTYWNQTEKLQSVSAVQMKDSNEWKAVDWTKIAEDTRDW